MSIYAPKPKKEEIKVNNSNENKGPSAVNLEKKGENKPVFKPVMRMESRRKSGGCFSG